MVDRTNLNEVNALYREWAQLEQAIHNLDNSGRINSMVVVGETPDVPSAIVNTQGWPYPPQMVEGIKVIATTRMNAIDQELTSMGLTGMPNGPTEQVARRPR